MSNTYYIRVVVDPGSAVRGINNIARSLDALDKKAERTQNLFRTLVAFDMTRRVVTGVARLSDSYADLETKIQRASGKNDLLTISMEKTFKAANRARADINAFGKTVLAMANATRNMNLGFDTSIRMAETLSKMLRLDGASASETKSVLLQYGQALRKGKLDGDEFRSVMENSSEVQKALAKSLGISTDELARYSKQGKITRQVMVDALIRESDRVDREFAQATMRIIDGITVIQNAAVRFFGELRIGEQITPILLFIADNFDTIGKAALVAANVLGAYFVRKGIALVISGMARLAVVMAANPFGAFLLGITAAVSALRVFGRDWRVATDGVATIGDTFSVAANKIGDAFGAIGSFIGSGIESFAEMMGEMVDISELSFKDVVVFGAIMADKLVATIEFMVEGVTSLFKAMGEQAINVLNEIIDGMNKISSVATPRLKKTAMFGKALYGDTLGDKNDPLTAGINDYTPDQYTRALGIVTKDNGGGMASPGQMFRASRLAMELSDIEYGLATDQGSAPQVANVNNPFTGATKDYIPSVIDANDKWKMKMDDTSGPAMRAVLAFFDDVEEKARGKKKDDRKGLMEAGEAGETTVSEKARRARESALKEYEALEASISGVYKAELELANAQETIEKARAHGIKISADREGYILARKRQLLLDQLDPYAALLRTMDEDMQKSRSLNGEWDVSLKLIEERNKLWEKGAFISQEQNEELERMLRLQSGLSDDQKRKQALLTGAGYVSPDEQRAYQLTQARLGATDDDDFARRAKSIEAASFQPQVVDLSTQEGRTKAYHKSLVDIVRIGEQWRDLGYEENAILAVQNSMLEQLNEKFNVLTVRQQSLTEGLKTGYQQAFHDLGSTASQVANLVTDSFNQMTDAVVDFVMTGKFGWQDLVESILRGMAQIATQRFFWELMKMVGGGSPVDGGVGKIGDGLMEPVFAAQGGLYKVHGQSGRDKVPAPMMLSDGEHVRVYPRGADPDQGRQAVGGNTNVIVVQNTESAMLAVMQSPSASKTTIQHVAVNEAYLRTMQRRS